MTVDAGMKRTSRAFSYQRIIIPLLTVLTDSQIRRCVVEERPNRLYAFLYGLGRNESSSLELRLVDMFVQLTERGSMADEIAERAKVLHWTEVALPLALYMKEVGHVHKKE